MRLNNFLCLPLAVGLMFVFCITSVAQNSRTDSYLVDSAVVSFRVHDGESTPIFKGDQLSLADSLKVISENGFDGYLRLISSHGTTYALYSPKKPASLKQMLFSSPLSKINKTVLGFVRGLFAPVAVTSVALRHHWGKSNMLPEGLSVSFICDNQFYSSFSEVPFDEPCEVFMTNTTDSVQVYSILFQYKTKESDPYQSVVTEKLPDGNPIILVPGESVTVPVSFYHPYGYLDYSISVFGGTQFFLLSISGDNPDKADVYAEKDDFNSVCYYNETNE